MCFCQNLHSQFMTEAGERLCVLNLIAPLATFFPEIGFLYVKNKSSRISNDFIYKLTSGNTTQKSMHVPDEREMVKIQWLLEQGGYPYSNRTKQHLKCKDHTCSIC